MTQFSAFNYTHNRDKAIANLINLIEGMTCDGKLSEKEMIFLDTWLMESDVLSQNYFVNCIRNKISEILSDGVVEKAELDELKDLLHEMQRGLMDTPNIDLYSADSDGDATNLLI
ncbi:hypothetical protein ASV15_20420 [Enterobacter hormaechei subsp. steigerwaltii]|uniref:hypothetical protein n=1 Tax=Enterobacter hormaechei TaxID=158836 RepID=UPI0007351A76|nr:hypothetical protein [Enterobacter hormaechei]KTH84997.1 hypothetical protein ASV15_20420 [Enterobacter hormaechei subsp. steigerwaltii]KTJ70266.1 hypothetical protein ASU77_08480 [Enterobacter hormaechei subsp. steigerwaltii]